MTTTATVPGCPVDESFDPLSPEFLADPYTALARRPDLASDLIAIHREAPERLTLDEISSTLFSLSFAGHETTTGLIGNAVRRLLEIPATARIS
jgi:cytochrome P450